MAIRYNVRQNALTSPPSNRCEVVAATIMGLDQIAEQINIHNPAITAATAKTVLEAFRQEVKTQLLAGNSVNMENFVSFVNTLPVKLVLPTDPLPDGKLNVSAKVSITLKDEMRAEASFVRLGYPVKAPQIVAGWDTNTDTSGWIRSGSPFKIQGVDLGVSLSDADTGVYLVYANGNEIKQSNIASVSPSSIIFVPDYTLPVGSQTDVDIKVYGRYTPAGAIRTFTYENKVRATNETLNLFGMNTGLSPVNYEAQAGGMGGFVQFIAQIKPDSTVTISAGYVGQTMGPEVVITGNGTDIPLQGVGSGDLLINVTDFDLLVTNITNYQKYMQEVVQLQITP